MVVTVDPPQSEARRRGALVKIKCINITGTYPKEAYGDGDAARPRDAVAAARLVLASVAEPPPQRVGVSNDEEAQHQQQERPGHPGPSTPPPCRCSVAQCPHDGLDHETTERTGQERETHARVRQPHVFQERRHARELRRPRVPDAQHRHRQRAQHGPRRSLPCHHLFNGVLFTRVAV